MSHVIIVSHIQCSYGLLFGQDIGPSKVHALPYGVAGRTYSPPLTAFFHSLSSDPVTFLTEGVVLGF